MAENCKQPGCNSPRRAKGYCPAHYERWRRGASPEKMAEPIYTPPDCSQSGCKRKHYMHGFCRAHFDRFQKGATADQMAEPIAQRSRGVITCGHPDRRLGGKGMCTSCYMKQWMKDNPDADSGNNWSRNHPEKARVLRRRASLKKRHGITEKDFEILWEKQQGKCANPKCDATFPLIMEDYRYGLQVDHDHKTGKLRSLLGGPCNRALGDVDVNSEQLAGLIEYLQSFSLN